MREHICEPISNAIPNILLGEGMASVFLVFLVELVILPYSGLVESCPKALREMLYLAGKVSWGFADRRWTNQHHLDLLFQDLDLLLFEYFTLLDQIYECAQLLKVMSQYNQLLILLFVVHLLNQRRVDLKWRSNKSRCELIPLQKGHKMF